MIDPFDLLERELVEAAGRIHPARVAWRTRWPRRGAPRPRILAVVVVLCLGSASAALAAAGVFQTGTPLEPATPVVATQSDGAATAQSAPVVVQASDPSGGLPWGVRVVTTTRGETCVQVGRVQSGTIGVLAQDGAFANDGEFHPLSDNYENPLSCTSTDANGHAFLNDVLDNMPASGYDGGCRLADQQQPRLPAGDQSSQSPLATCSPGDLREVYYGLLGPDALSVSYANASGQIVTTPTAGPDGAYLIVLPYVAGGALCGPNRPVCPTNTMGIANGIWADGVIRSVQYGDGQTCSRTPNLPLGQQKPCPQEGYLAPATRPLTAADVASPITVKADGPSQVTVSFTSRVAITNSNSYYYFNFDSPTPANPSSGSASSVCSPSDSSDFLTYSDYQPGQLVTDTQSLPSCAGVVHGTVTLVTNGDSHDHLPGIVGQNALLVGNFSFDVP